MANYTLLVLTFNDEAHRALRADNNFGSYLDDLAGRSRQIKINHLDAPDVINLATTQSEVKAGPHRLGETRGMFYDARIVKTLVQPGETVCVIKHDHVDRMRGATGKPVARALRDFSKASPDARQNFISGDAFVPVYKNDTDKPQIVEIHKTHARLEGDPHTRWEYDPRTTYTHLVNA